MSPEDLKKYFPKSKRAKATSRGKVYIASEAQEQNRIIGWLRKEHPYLIWNFDLAGTTDLISGFAADFKAEGFKVPDFHLIEPRGDFHGMYIELKKSDFKFYKRDGEVKKNEHIQAQADSLERLRGRGYYADFARGFPDAKEKIEAYLQEQAGRLDLLKILK